MANTFDNRQGDLGLYNTLNGGTIKIQNGEPLMDQGLETAVYISLEGAGEKPWFANEYLTESEKITSQFAKFRQSRELSSGVIVASEDLIKKDLQWLINDKATTSINPTMRIIGRNRVEIVIDVTIDGKTFQLSPFQLNWKAQDEYPLHNRVE